MCPMHICCFPSCLLQYQACGKCFDDWTVCVVGWIHILLTYTQGRNIIENAEVKFWTFLGLQSWGDHKKIIDGHFFELKVVYSKIIMSVCWNYYKVMNILYIYIKYFESFIYLFLIFICSGFCHTLKWNSHGFTCVPHPDPSSHLPPHPLPLGFPIAPGPSTCLMHPTWAGDPFHPR